MLTTIEPATGTSGDDGGDDGGDRRAGPAGPARPSRPGRRVGRLLRRAAVGLGIVVGLLVAVVAYSSFRTEGDIRRLRTEIVEVAEANPGRVYDPAAIADLPEPVQRYFEYVFGRPGGTVDDGAQGAPTHVEMTMSGEFRRPLTEGFSPTTAEQTTAIGTPALVFSARTTVVPGLWARAYDAYADGEMEMKAKILSTLTVVDESETAELNQTSLQRWLLESPLYPAALLPGGPVRWEAIDDTRARAIVAADGLEASLVATFRADGSLRSFDAEHDGDLTTPYHGSGEHVLRTDYREVDGMMIPHGFTIARAAGGKTFPFWVGQIDEIAYHRVAR